MSLSYLAIGHFFPLRLKKKVVPTLQHYFTTFNFFHKFLGELTPIASNQDNNNLPSAFEIN